MSQIKVLITFTSLIAPVLLSIAFGTEGYLIGIAAAVVLGLWGMFDLWRVMPAWSSDVYLWGMVLLAAIGALMGLANYLLLLAVLSSLGTWDLIRFSKRMAHAQITTETTRIVKHHMRLLGFTLLCGGVLGAGMLITSLQISFSIMVILGIILVISLGEIVRSLNFKDRY